MPSGDRAIGQTQICLTDVIHLRTGGDGCAGTPGRLTILRDVRDEYVKKEAPPASTLVGATSLFQDDYLLEVDAVAVIPQKL